MTWQFNEPWPNVQCSNVLEYYGGKKLAYYAIRDAYESVLTSLKYKKLFYDAGENFEAEIWLINDRPDADYTISYRIVTEDGRELSAGQFTGTAREDISFKVGSISAQLPDDLTGSFSILLDTACGDFRDTKEYMMLIADLEIPIEISAEEKMRLERMIKRFGANPFDAKRADTAPVIRYVDRWWDKINK